MQKAEKRLASILKRAKKSGVSSDDISEYVTGEVSKHERLKRLNTWKTYLCSLCSIPKWQRSYAQFTLIILALLVVFGKVYFKDTSECLIEMPFDETKVFRKPEDCSMCRGVTQVQRVANISHVDFDALYASTATPVIITDGTKGWSAVDLFTFDFFKSLYAKHEGRTVCQFFPYQTEFDSLREVLNMSEARARLAPGSRPWYIGWSNCNDRAGQELRRHYARPYFLSPISENMALSWIFMGGPGEGAHMHVDNVHYASWQAQLRGRKKWRLAPPPECRYACDEFTAIVHPGEIIVVDTNRWYHQTHILPGDISITIGTEFD